MKRKEIWGFGFVAMLLVALPLGAAGAEEVLKIGFTGPLTGPGSPWGIMQQKAMLLEAEQYNAAGGLTIEGKKYKIEVLSEDDKYSPIEGVNVTNKLIFKDKVKFIAGPIGSVVVVATRPLIEENKIISVPTGYTPKALTKYSFRLQPTMGEVNGPMFKWIKENIPNIKKASLLGPNDETGWSILAEYLFVCQNLGFEVVAEEYYERNTADYYPVLTRLLNNKPDILLLDASTGDLGLILKQVRQMGYKGPTISSNPHDAKQLCKVAGKEAAEGHIHSGPHLVPGRIQKWHDQFVARWGEWDASSIIYGDSLDYIVAGIKAANSLDTDKVRVAMENMNFESRFWGPVKIGGKRRYGIAHQVLLPIPVSQVRNCDNVGLVLAPPQEPFPPPKLGKQK